MSLRHPIRPLSEDEISLAYPRELVANFETGDLILINTDGTQIRIPNGLSLIISGDGNAITGLEVSGHGITATKDKSFLTKESVVITDKVNGYDYIVEVHDGTLVTYCACDHIELTRDPEVVEYEEGEAIDTSGMVITAYSKDGNSRVIEDYKCVPEVAEAGLTSFNAVYTEGGLEYSVEVPITVKVFDPAVDLIDFEYTEEEDGTYTLTGWKGTLNGEHSTEIVIPNSSKINL